MRQVFVLGLVVLLFGCATSSKISAVQLGMTKEEVISVMGAPVSVSAKGETEYFNYALSENSDQAFYGITKPYYVRLVDGKVDSFGRTGDFDSTQPTTVRVESDANMKVGDDADLYTELRKLKQLKDEGILSDTEYEELKQKAIRED